jgi:hypothetical protein
MLHFALTARSPQGKFWVAYLRVREQARACNIGGGENADYFCTAVPLFRAAQVASKAIIAERLARAGLAPRGLSREQSAGYIGVSPNLFDEMVGDGRMPRAKQINGRKVWDRHRLDAAFAALPDEAGNVETDDVWAAVAV